MCWTGNIERQENDFNDPVYSGIRLKSAKCKETRNERQLRDNVALLGAVLLQARFASKKYVCSIPNSGKCKINVTIQIPGSGLSVSVGR